MRELVGKNGAELLGRQAGQRRGRQENDRLEPADQRRDDDRA
jgi:hypothetical protein